MGEKVSKKREKALSLFPKHHLPGEKQDNKKKKKQTTPACKKKGAGTGERVMRGEESGGDGRPGRLGELRGGVSNGEVGRGGRRG